MGNAGFELPSLTSGGWSNSPASWTNPGTASDSFVEYISGFNAEGNQHLGMNLNTTVQQDPGGSYAANTVYRLQVAAGNRAGFSAAGNLSTYRLTEPGATATIAGSFDAFANVAPGAFADAPPLFVSTATTPVLVGKTIRIQLSAQGAGRSHFDKVRLDSGTVADFTTVTTASDSGPGSLREALAAAAAITGANTITFAPALAGQTITLASEIAVADTGGVTIDACALPTGLTIDGGPGTNRIFRVHSSGILTLRCLTLTGGNGTGADAASGSGGAILVNSSTATLTNCTLSGNSASSSGGAIYNGGTLTLTNCTFSGNSTTVNGGAIYNGNTMTLTHCTLSGNSAGTGGAIYNAGSITIKNTIAAGNSAPASPNTFGSFTSTNCYFGTDPRLGPLADNGGPTKTMALLPGSPALDAASVVSGLATDQRGLPRNRDGNATAGALPDIGAYEAQVAPVGSLGFNFNGASPRNLLTTDRAGAPEFAQTHWNNLTGDWDGAQNAPLSRTLSGGATASLRTWYDGTGVFQFGPSDTPDRKLMSGFVYGPLAPGNGNSGTNLYSANNQPFFALADLPATFTLGGYRVVVYADTDAADGRVIDYWLTTHADPIDVSGTTSLSPHLFLRDTANFTGANYTRVPATSTSLAGAVAGNYLVFENQAQPGFILRTEDNGQPGAIISAVQIVRNEILTVTTAADELDPVGTAGTGLSLREAIARAPDGAGIVFDPAVFTGGAANTITLSDPRGEIFLSKSVTIDASNLATGITIDGGPGTNRIFSVNSGKSVAMRNLTLTGGNGSGVTNSGYGGAILNFGTLTLTQCTLSGNSALYRGAIANFGTLTLTQCTISGNSASNDGGAIDNSGTLALTRCTLSGNSASNGGGAIANFGTLTLTQCTLSGNSASYIGGAIYNNGTLALTQCTLSGNSATNGGGAILNDGTLTLTHCTLSGNSANFNGGAIYNERLLTLTQCTLSGNSANFGGAIYNDGSVLTLTNSLIAGNTAPGGPDILQISGTITPTGVNLIGSLAASSLTAGPNVLVNPTPLLAPLGNYGGPTQTMALLPGSPARNAATVLAPALTTDQRGFPVFGTPDIGAYEAQIGSIANVTTSEGVTTAPIPFSVGQVGTLSAASSVPGLVSGFSFGGSGGSRTVTITPAPGQTGTATITVTDSLSGETATFTLTVVPFVPPVVTSDADSGPGTLRQALADAAAHAGPDTITFTGSGRAVVLFSEIVIADTGGVSIDASAVSGGARIYSSSGTNRLFSVSAGTNLTLTGLSLFGGGGTGAVQSGNGGAIYVASAAAVSLVQCRVTDNKTTGPSTVGGGIYSHGTLTLTRCTFDGNTAVYEGGAVRSQTSALTAESCTFSRNTAEIGGAISMANAGPTAQLTHCTIAGNTATGIYDAGLGNIGGGGIFFYAQPAVFTGCLIAGNTSPDGPDLQNFAGNPASGGSNLIGKNTGLTWTPLPSDKIGTGAAPLDVKLAPLNYYGGPLPTMPPLPGSPAIDAAAVLSPALTADQRGVPRPLNGDDNGTAAPDIGAVEALPASRLIVQNTSDTGPGSLRQAIADAAYMPGQNAITFAPALSGQTITLASEIVISISSVAALTVDATSLPGGLTIDGGPGTNRIFCIASSTITMAGLTLTGGNGTGAAGSGTGGAIYNVGTLTLTQCTLSGNSANSGHGGAISNFGTLTLTQCTLSGNSASQNGGAIYNNATLTLTQCTLSGNSASRYGGALLNGSGTLTLTQCTLSGNSANSGHGGAIFNNATLTLTNNLIAGNTASSGPDILNGGTITPTGVNLIGNLANSSLTARPNVIENPAPGLAPLGNYGGPTQTMALLPGSPARNAAAVLDPAITTDQRGFPIVGTPDIGAYEAGTHAPNYNAYIHETLPAAATPAEHATNFDYDNDGATNFDEWLALTAAADPASRFTLSSGGFTGGNLAFSFPTAPGRNYTLELSSTLAPGSWTPVQGAINLPGNGNVYSSAIGPVTGIPRLYLRVIPSLP